MKACEEHSGTVVSDLCCPTESGMPSGYTSTTPYEPPLVTPRDTMSPPRGSSWGGVKGDEKLRDAMEGLEPRSVNLLKFRDGVGKV